MVYGAACAFATYTHQKEVLEQVCFTAADCRPDSDLPPEGFGGSSISVTGTGAMVASSSTVTGAGIVAWPGAST